MWVAPFKLINIIKRTLLICMELILAAGFVSVSCFSFENRVRRTDSRHISAFHSPMTLLNHYFRFDLDNMARDTVLKRFKSNKGYFSGPSPC